MACSLGMFQIYIILSLSKSCDSTDTFTPGPGIHCSYTNTRNTGNMWMPQLAACLYLSFLVSTVAFLVPWPFESTYVIKVDSRERITGWDTKEDKGSTVMQALYWQKGTSQDEAMLTSKETRSVFLSAAMLYLSKDIG